MTGFLSELQANLPFVFSPGLLAAAMRMSTPILLAALGFVIASRAGILNLGLEGMMLFGAFTSVVTTYNLGSPWLGVAVAGAATAGLGLGVGAMCIRFRATQSVVGLGLNIVVVGLTTVGVSALWDVTGTSPSVRKLPPVTIGLLRRCPTLDAIFGSQNPIAWVALGMVFLLWILLFRTPIGVQMRATGENPAAADTAGVPVFARQLLGMALSGLLCGLGGADLTLGQLGYFGYEMTAGRGWMGFAVAIFGCYHPAGALLGSVIFGVLDALQLRVASLWQIPSQWLRMVPYLATILVVAGVGGVRPPRALGKPYTREGK